MQAKKYLFSILVLGAAAALPGSALANERHFSFTYESAVLPAGAKELEVWTTPRVGRDQFYSRFDQRLEFEVGITDRLLTAFYLNASAITAEVAPGVRESTYEFEGVSSEWKYKLADPVANALGLALYGEVTGSTNEFELEAKLIADKKLGNLMLAGNLVLESELEFEAEETESEMVVELALGAAYFLSSHLSVGLELVNHNEFPEGSFEHSALFAGPVIAYATESWWVTATVMPQLPALKGHEGGGSRVLDEHEKVMGRILFSFHL